MIQHSQGFAQQCTPKNIHTLPLTKWALTMCTFIPGNSRKLAIANMIVEVALTTRTRTIIIDDEAGILHIVIGILIEKKHNPASYTFKIYNGDECLIPEGPNMMIIDDIGKELEANTGDTIYLNVPDDDVRIRNAAERGKQMILTMRTGSPIDQRFSYCPGTKDGRYSTRKINM